jgi:hypothetical protein
LRNDPRPRFEPRTSRGYGAPRALIVGIGLFVITLGVLAAVLFVNGDDSSKRPSVATLPSPTPSASPTRPAAAAPPSATVTTQPTATSTDTQQPTATDTATDVEEPTETPTEDVPTPTDEPAADTPTVETAPTAAPAEGEFGQLPPAEIPSGGLGRDLSLQYDLGVTLDSAPSEADVYQLVWPDRSAADVTALAASLGVSGDVVDQGDGAFKVDGPDGSVFVTPDVVQISLEHADAGGALDDDATLVDAARTWLLDNNLVGADLGDGAVTNKDTAAARATVYFATADPSPLLAAYPSARVTLGPGGLVYEAYVKWPANYATASYALSAASDLWAAVQAGQGYVEADLSGVPGDGALTGTLTVTSVSLAYSTAGSATGHEYLVPIMVFSGEAVVGDDGTSVPVSVYVPAVAGQSAPRG